MTRYAPGSIKTKDWTMGHYPMPQPLPDTDADLVAELRGFHHYRGANRLEQVLAELAQLKAAAEPEQSEIEQEEAELIEEEFASPT